MRWKKICYRDQRLYFFWQIKEKTQAKILVFFNSSVIIEIENIGNSIIIYQLRVRLSEKKLKPKSISGFIAETGSFFWAWFSHNQICPLSLSCVISDTLQQLQHRRKMFVSTAALNKNGATLVDNMSIIIATWSSEHSVLLVLIRYPDQRCRSRISCRFTQHFKMKNRFHYTTLRLMVRYW